LGFRGRMEIEGGLLSSVRAREEGLHICCQSMANALPQPTPTPTPNPGQPPSKHYKGMTMTHRPDHVVQLDAAGGAGADLRGIVGGHGQHLLVLVLVLGLTSILIVALNLVGSWSAAAV